MNQWKQEEWGAGDGKKPDELFPPNFDPRCPVVLLLDRSGSMAGRPIAELNAGLQTFRDELMKDELARRRVEIAIVSFGPVTQDQDFVTAEGFQPPTLSAGGDTPMGRAILVGLEMVERRRNELKAQGLPYFKPWVFLITDGGPTDGWAEAAQRVRELDRELDPASGRARLAFFAVGTQDADFSTLAKISRREPLRLTGLKFRDLFIWLSASLQGVSRSSPNDAVRLPPPDWASV